ncbi:hypothetical protein DENSPDRAFT_577692 [Dentipellis sp. KUC8613]|nr:hypothetical protein DENSPDRAFT_577692 [Dentipellis sp. KUC8613]
MLVLPLVIFTFVLGGIILPPIAYVALKFSLTLSGSSHPLLETLEALVPVHIALATRPNGTGQEISIPALTLVFAPPPTTATVYSNVSDSLPTIIVANNSVSDYTSFDYASLQANAADVENVGLAALAAQLGRDAWAVVSRKDVALVAFVVAFVLIVSAELYAWNKHLLLLTENLGQTENARLQMYLQATDMQDELKQLDTQAKQSDETAKHLDGNMKRLDVTMESISSMLKILAAADASGASKSEVTNILSFSADDKKAIKDLAKEILEPLKYIAHQHQRQQNTPPRHQKDAQQMAQSQAPSVAVTHAASDFSPQLSHYQQSIASQTPYVHFHPSPGQQPPAQAGGQWYFGEPDAYAAEGSTSHVQPAQTIWNNNGYTHPAPRPTQNEEQFRAPPNVQGGKHLPSPMPTNKNPARQLQEGASHAAAEAGNTQASATKPRSYGDHRIPIVAPHSPVPSLGLADSMHAPASVAPPKASSPVPSLGLADSMHAPASAAPPKAFSPVPELGLADSMHAPAAPLVTTADSTAESTQASAFVSAPAPVPSNVNDDIPSTEAPVEVLPTTATDAQPESATTDAAVELLPPVEAPEAVNEPALPPAPESDQQPAADTAEDLEAQAATLEEKAQALDEEARKARQSARLLAQEARQLCMEADNCRIKRDAMKMRMEEDKKRGAEAAEITRAEGMEAEARQRRAEAQQLRATAAGLA